jgi:acetyl-CoA carboxylase carboxyltransferase component
MVMGTLENTSSAVNDEANWDIVLPPGTYSMEVQYLTSSSRGIQTWKLDDGAGTFTTLGTIDGYSAVATFNLRTKLTGIVVPSSTKRRLKVLMATKNGSASNFLCDITSIAFQRTA